MLKFLHARQRANPLDTRMNTTDYIDPYEYHMYQNDDSSHHRQRSTKIFCKKLWTSVVFFPLIYSKEIMWNRFCAVPKGILDFTLNLMWLCFIHDSLHWCQQCEGWWFLPTWCSLPECCLLKVVVSGHVFLSASSASLAASMHTCLANRPALVPFAMASITAPSMVRMAAS